MRDDAPTTLDTADDRWRWAQKKMPALVRYAFSLTSVPELAYDAVAHAVAHADESPARTPADLYVWLTRLVRNFVVDDARSRGTARALSLLAGTDLTVVTDPAESVADADDDRWLLSLVADTLTPREYDVMQAHGDGRSAADLAPELGMTAHSVETLLWRARTRCKKRLAAARAGLGSLLPWPRKTWRRALGHAAAPVALALALGLCLLAFRLPAQSSASGSPSETGGAGSPTRAAALPKLSPTPKAGVLSPAPLPASRSRAGQPWAGRQPSMLPTALTSQLRRQNDGDTTRTLPEEVMHCVENAVPSLPPPTSVPDPCAYPTASPTR